MISKVSLILFGLALVLSAEAFSVGSMFGGQEGQTSGFGGSEGGQMGGEEQSNDFGGAEGGQMGQEGQSHSHGHSHAHGQGQGQSSSGHGQAGQQGGDRHHHNRGGRSRQGGRGGFDLSKYVKFQNCDSTAPIQIQNFNITMRKISGRVVSSSSNISNNLFFNFGVSVDQPAFSVQLLKNLPLSSFPLAQTFVNLSGLNQTFSFPTMALRPPMGPGMFGGADSQISDSQIELIKNQLESFENSTFTTTFSAVDASQKNVACFQLIQDGSLIAKAMKMFDHHGRHNHEQQSQEGSEEGRPEGPSGPESQDGDEQGPDGNDNAALDD